MQEIEFAYKSLRDKFNWSIYKDCISHYGNNLLNLLVMKYEFNSLTNELSSTEINNVKKDILLCIKDLEVILEDKSVLDYLKKHYDNWNYDSKRVLIAVKNVSKYIKKYYK